jgi:hypothetical protein
MRSCTEDEAREEGARWAPGESAPCVNIGAGCDGPYAPAVSSDCGINSPIVRQWATGAPGTVAPWGLSSTLREVCCDDDGCASGEAEDY